MFTSSNENNKKMKIDRVKIKNGDRYDGKTYQGIFLRWFKCEFSGDEIGIVKCYDGEEKAFLLEDIKDDEDMQGIDRHHIGCNCYECL